MALCGETHLQDQPGRADSSDNVRGYVNEDVQPLDLLSQERLRTIDTVLVNIGGLVNIRGLVNIWGLWTFVLMDIWAYWICGLTSKGLAIAP